MIYFLQKLKLFYNDKVKYLFEFYITFIFRLNSSMI